MKIRMGLALVALLAGTLPARAETALDACCRRADIQIRDPFVLVADGRYYLYEAKPWFGGTSVFVRVSHDLERWTERREVAVVPPEIPCEAVWAPEVHKFGGSYYLFVTITQRKGTFPIKALGKNVQERHLQPRGTWVFKSDSPSGPFRPVKAGPVPPQDRMTLDGTLYVEEGVPYMVYCHEWCQTGDGTIEYAPLTPGFDGFAAAPKHLLTATKTIPGAAQATDGPFFYRSPKSNRLFMIWSNYLKNKYALLVRRSDSGKIAGPWSADEVLFCEDGGHAMIFRTLDGRLRLTLHQPNEGAPERMRLFDLADDGEHLKIVGRVPMDQGRVHPLRFSISNDHTNLLYSVGEEATFGSLGSKGPRAAGRVRRPTAIFGIISCSQSEEEDESLQIRRVVAGGCGAAQQGDRHRARGSHAAHCRRFGAWQAQLGRHEGDGSSHRACEGGACG